MCVDLDVFVGNDEPNQHNWNGQAHIPFLADRSSVSADPRHGEGAVHSKYTAHVYHNEHAQAKNIPISHQYFLQKVSLFGVHVEGSTT